MKVTCLALSLLLAAAPARAGADTPAAPVTDPDVLKGIRLVDDGDYDAAIFTLDAATRRLAAQSPPSPDLSQAYVYLGIAYLGKGHDPKVVDAFEAARTEAAAAPPVPAPTPSPATATATAAPPKENSRKTAALVIAGVAALGGAVVLVVGGGDSGSSSSSGTSSSAPTTNTFPNEVVVFGGGRDYVVDVKGSGTLTAKVDWVQDGVLLGMYIVNLANSGQVLMNGGQTASKQLTLSLPVTAGSYRISVTNSTGAGPHVDTTFTLTVTHP